MIARHWVLSPLVAALGLWVGAATAGDATKGERVYKKCKACHQVGEGAKKRTGPPLNDIIDAKAGLFEGFKYSAAFKAAAEGGLIWTTENLDTFLENPKAFIPKTRMSFKGLKAPEDRADVIAYLQTFSKPEQTAMADEGFVVSAELLAIEGDAEYGEFLSSECVTCHKRNGENDGIPGIIGWEVEPFVTAMHAYREKHRTNEVMQLVAGRLNDEEIASLAVYFLGLEGN